MQPRSFIAVVLIVTPAIVAACAKGTGIGDETEGGGGEGAGTTSNGGGGSQAVTGSEASASAASTSGAGGTGGAECAETPCKLVTPQCGCDAGQACTIVLPTTQNPTGRVCKAEGKAKIAEVCGTCEAGALCVQASASVSTCLEFCDDDSMCNAPGGLCAIKLNDGSPMGEIPDVTLCSDNCDPPTSTGCPVAGTSCQLGKEPDGQMRYFTMCRGAGTGMQGAACTLSDECALGFGCFTLNSVMQCLKYCLVGGASACPAATTCNPFNPVISIGSTEYGACT